MHILIVSSIGPSSSKDIYSYYEVDTIDHVYSSSLYET